MNILGLTSDLASFGAAGIMGGMWLWERRASVNRERQLSEAHGRILRDEQRLDKLTEVIAQNTAAIARFHETQRQFCETLKHIHKEIHHEPPTP